MLLILVFVISSFLDNIAAALIGATVAKHVFKGNVRVGYLAAVVGASNAGGSGSVIGDTTTTMLWIAGVSPLSVLHAYVAAGCALFVSGILLARPAEIRADRQGSAVRSAHLLRHVAVVIIVLGSAIAANVGAHFLDASSGRVPLIGLAVAAAILLTIPIARPDWSIVPRAARGDLPHCARLRGIVDAG